MITWPLVAGLSSRFGATSGPGDPFLNLWILGWDLETISSHPGWLLTGRIFDGNIFFPATGTLAYSDHQIIQALAVWPLYAATRNPTLCYNIVLLLSLIVSAWTMFAFTRSMTGSTMAAYCAGLVWGFCPYRFSHLIHLQLQSLYWMPLTFWILNRLVAGRRKRDAVWLGVVFALQAVSSVYYGVIGAVGLAVGGAVTVWRTGHWPPRLAGRFVLAALVAIVVAAPGLWPYLRVQQREGFGRTLFEAQHNSAALSSYFRAPPTNLIYGRTGWLRSSRDETRDEPEQDLFPGFLVLALAVAGLVRSRKQGMGLLAASMAAVGAAGLLLSLGPEGLRPVYATLYDWVFGFQAIRAPARFSVLVFFALAVLAGIGLEALVRASRCLSVWPALLALLFVGAEYSNGAIAFVPAPAHSTEVGRWLRDAPEPGPVLYLPIGTDRDDSSAMVASLEHLRPIVNGHSGQRPALYPAIVDQVSAFPDPLALLTLRELGVRFVIAPQRVAATSAPTPLAERASSSGSVVYELRWTPAISAAFDEMDDVAPLAPGPLPFRESETTRYRVRWVGGPMALPAGEAVISAERVADGGFRIAVHATTSGWVRSFFEADDLLGADTDGQLLPRVYRESLNEGRRRVRRTVSFDPPARRVMVTNGDLPPVALPLRRGARDPLSALFYARTLPLAAGFHAPVLVNDAGRNTIVDVRVAGADVITIDGRPYDAWKLEPTFIARLAWREPPRATVWVSRDSRKVPLLIRVSAAFGTVDVERVDYQSR